MKCLRKFAIKLRVAMIAGELVFFTLLAFVSLAVYAPGRLLLPILAVNLPEEVGGRAIIERERPRGLAGAARLEIGLTTAVGAFSLGSWRVDAAAEVLATLHTEPARGEVGPHQGEEDLALEHARESPADTLWVVRALVTCLR